MFCCFIKVQHFTPLLVFCVVNFHPEKFCWGVGVLLGVIDVLHYENMPMQYIEIFSVAKLKILSENF